MKQPTDNKPMRLDRFLCEAGVGSRSQVKKLIHTHKVTVIGKTDITPELKIDPKHDSVMVEGKRIDYQKYHYYMLHKPAGMITATKDAKETTVMSLLPGVDPAAYFPVGRLDKDTEGLLLITNDGALAHRLLSPKKHVQKIYLAKVRGVISLATIRAFSEGLSIGNEKMTLPAKLTVLSEQEDFYQVKITIVEGRYHQIKRMFAAVGCEVIYLKRLSMGTLTLDETLLPGSYRELTVEETERLRHADS